MAIVGYYIVHYLAGRRDKRKELNDAAKAFRDAFIPMKQRLRQESIRKIMEIMQTEFPSQDVAMQRFAPYLAGKKLSDFKKLWKEYEEKHDAVKYINPDADIMYNNGNKLKSITTEITTLSENILFFANPR